MRWVALAAGGLLVTLALGACAVGAHHSAGSSSATTPAATDTSTATTGTGTGTGTATSAATSAGSTTTSSASGRVDNGHGRGKRGTKGVPGAPAGLTQTAGYGSYERCQGTCTGAVPAALRRPLKLPTEDGGPCPITIHPQPAFTGKASAGLGFRSVSGSEWSIAEVTWAVPASYTGPLLIRGAMLGGDPIGFGTGAVPYDELQLLDAGRGAPRVAGGGRAWVTYTRVRGGGCYAYQVDGTGFSEVIVFRAVA